MHSTHALGLTALVATLLVPAPSFADQGRAADVFLRCLASPIQPALRAPRPAGERVLFVDEDQGLRWTLPPTCRILDQGTYDALLVVGTPSGLLGVVLDWPRPAGGATLDQLAADYRSSVAKDPRIRITGEHAHVFAGAPARQFLLEIEEGGKTQCGVRLMALHGGLVYGLDVLQRPLQRQCLGDYLVDVISEGWTWTVARAPGRPAR